MLIAHMKATKELVGITADTGPDADIAVMVTPTHHTGFIGSTYAPSAVVTETKFWYRIRSLASTEGKE